MKRQMSKNSVILIFAAFILGSAGRAQGAPLSFSYDLKGPAVVDSPVTVTSGTVTAISCSWESEGEVRVEVSANGGGSYAAIRSGQIMDDGFIPGNRLCFRVTLLPGSGLSNVTLGYKDSSGAVALYRNSKWDAFKYKRQVAVSATGTALTNWPVRVRIGADIYTERGLAENFKDIRFAGEDGQTELNYYLEKVDIRDGLPVSADFWVKVPQVPAAGCVFFAYYGNAAAKDCSDGARVFPFFDDFNGTGLDTAKWQIKPGLDKKCVVKDGKLELAECSVISDRFRIKKGIIEFKAMAQKNTAIQAVVRGVANPRYAYPLEQLVYSSAFPGAEHAIAVNDVAKLNAGSPIKPLVEYIYRVILDQSGIVFERYSEDNEKQAEIRFLNMDSGDEGYIGLKASADLVEKGAVFFDWVRVRPYAGTEPIGIIAGK